MYFIIFIGIISCFTSVIGSPVNAVVNSTYGNACKSDRDCSFMIENCRGIPEHDGDPWTCICSFNYVWDDEYQSCVRNCFHNEDYCEYEMGVCDLSEEIPRCKCQPGTRWDPVRKSCVHVCWSDHHCDMKNELCDMSQDRYVGNCICKDGYTWDVQYKACRKICTSLDMICPGYRELCYDYSTHCSCEHTWDFNRFTKTCEPLFW